MKHIADTTELHNGVKMPWLGLGVWKMAAGGEVRQAIRAALDAGYRSIDTAAIYRNEEGVGQAVKESSVPRKELFITTKVWNENQGYETTLKAFEESRRKLGLDYVDLYLIHWPMANKGKYKETWRALEKLYKDGQVRAIGVSNFQTHHLQELLRDCEVAPMLNQVEFHPQLTQLTLRAFCRENRIQLEAWSPLMQGNLGHPALQGIASKYGKSPAQIVLRWDLQHGVVTIPKSSNPERIRQNADIFDFELAPEDIAAIDALNVDKRYGGDPDTFH